MTKTVSEKMGIKVGTRAFFLQAPDDALEAIGLPLLERASTLTGEFDYIHLFATQQTELHDRFPALKAHLKQTGMAWVSWPKGGKLATDLSLTKVIEIGYDYGLVESKSIRVNDTWSALKFTHPKKGKVYNNSYGKLKP